MKKQTAVQFCADKIDLLAHKYFLGAIKGIEYYEKLTKIVKEAMDLEKEQITDAHYYGGCDFQELQKSQNEECPMMSYSEEYYNKTFNQ
jgi:hypothetical protein